MPTRRRCLQVGASVLIGSQVGAGSPTRVGEVPTISGPSGGRSEHAPPLVNEATLFAEDADEEDAFGYAVDIDGDTALIGAVNDEDPNGRNGGSAYVFGWDEGEWVQRTKLAPEDPTEGEQDFGKAVAIDGDTALVSASASGLESAVESVYVFTRTGGEWSQQTRLIGEGVEPAEPMGYGDAIALDGDNALVGAPGYHIENESGEDLNGAVYLFTRSGGSWTEASSMTTPDVDTKWFGTAVALDGERALVGAPEDTNDSITGDAFVMSVSGGDLSIETRLPGTGLNDTDFFGRAVALDGDRAVVGAPGVDESDYVTSRGQAHVYERTADGWTETATLVPQIYDQGTVGDAVGLWEDTIVVGGSWSARIYDYTGDAWEMRTARAYNPSHENAFADAIAMDGPQVLIGAPEERTAPPIGGAYVIHTNATAEVTLEDQSVTSRSPAVTVASATANVNYVVEIRDDGETIGSTEAFVADESQTDLEVALETNPGEATLSAVVLAANDETELGSAEADVTVEAEPTSAEPTPTPTQTPGGSPSEATASGTTAPAGTTAASSPEGTDAPDETTSADTPGFGIGSVLAALGSAGYLLARRGGGGGGGRSSPGAGVESGPGPGGARGGRRRG